MPLQPTLVGALLTLRPLAPSDWQGLYRLAGDPLLCEQHPSRERWLEPVFRRCLDEWLASGGTLVAPIAAGRVVGCSRFSREAAAADEIEIGWTMLGRAWWGG